MAVGRTGLALVVALIASLCVACSGTNAIRIGVLMPMTGPDALHYDLPLRWALDNANAASGRKIELVYTDIGKEKLRDAAQRLANDPKIAAVIGPDTSQRVFEVAPLFIEKKKVFITPSATSTELFRAFATEPFFWRTVESDIGQTRVLLTLAARAGAKTIAFIGGDDAYGKTFFDWFGFLDSEIGIKITDDVRYDMSNGSCGSVVDGALAKRPDVLIVAPSNGRTTTCVAREWRAHGNGVRLLFTDGAEDPNAMSAAGSAADGLEGTGIAPDASSGFVRAFSARFHRSPTPYAAQTYDALTLLAYGLQRSRGVAGSRLAAAMRSVVDGTGQRTSWDAHGVASALGSLRSGGHPDVTGASGPLIFDRFTHTEPVSTTYEHWRYERGRFRTLESLSTGNTPSATDHVAEFRRHGSARRLQQAGGTYTPVRRTGLWALLVAASSGWENYRHQADVLAQYRRLRDNGVPRDHIIVVMADDVANNPDNPDPPSVPYVPGGPSLYKDFTPDYRVSDMSAQTVLDILAGRKTAATPKVIASSPGDDVYVFIAGHGNEAGVDMGLVHEALQHGDRDNYIGPSGLASTIASMYASHRYRRLLAVVEACDGGVMGTNVSSPGAMVLSGADTTEDSESANYDEKLSVWLADEFSYDLWKIEGSEPDISLADVHRRLYESVHGSHPTAWGPNFGDTDAVKLSEFVSP